MCLLPASVALVVDTICDAAVIFYVACCYCTDTTRIQILTYRALPHTRLRTRSRCKSVECVRTDVPFMQCHPWAVASCVITHTLLTHLRLLLLSNWPGGIWEDDVYCKRSDSFDWWIFSGSKRWLNKRIETTKSHKACSIIQLLLNNTFLHHKYFILFCQFVEMKIYGTSCFFEVLKILFVDSCCVLLLSSRVPASKLVTKTFLLVFLKLAP